MQCNHNTDTASFNFFESICKIKPNGILCYITIYIKLYVKFFE